MGEENQENSVLPIFRECGGGNYKEAKVNKGLVYPSFIIHIKNKTLKCHNRNNRF